MTRPYTLLSTARPDSLLPELLNQRGIAVADFDDFLTPSYESLHDPYLLHDMDKAVARLTTAIEQQEQIAIFSDYDCDGIPGAVVLHDFFVAVGHKQFTNVIPHRHYDGFGLSVTAVEKMSASGATLIITIDCGTTDGEAISRAAELGVDVIVTDHHEPPAILPQATAIVNPKLGTYPFPHLCGAAVAFKLAVALLTTGRYPVAAGQEKWWLDMVGIATIADMVPLVGENRILAKYGLMVLRKSRRPGLQQLLRKNRLPQQHLTEDDVGFTIGPRINAASRMDAPEHAFTLLTTRDEGEAGAYVERLEHLNNERKGVVATMTKEIHGRMKELTDIPSVIVMGNPLWRPALVGLAANKLAEDHSRPVFLWGRDGNGVIKGSCRAGGGVSVVRLMEAVAPVFLEYGGHHASGGFSVHETAIFDLGTNLNDAFHMLGEAALVKEEWVVDALLRLDDIYGPIRQIQRDMAPFGTGYTRPLFAFEGVAPVAVEQFGKSKEHLKLTFKTTHGSVEAIAFFASVSTFTLNPTAEQPLTLLAHIEESYFMGRQTTRLRIVDIV